MIQHALRTIGRMPGLAAVVILSLGVGIGVNTAVFSWIQAIVLKPIPGVERQRQLLSRRSEGRHRHVSRHVVGRVSRSEAAAEAIDDLIAFRMAPLNVGETGRTERTYALLVSGNYFAALGLRPAAGRFIRPDEALSRRRAAGRR